MRYPIRLALLVVLWAPAGFAAASPEQQVFQFACTAINDTWPDGRRNEANAYLWIPERCERVRGLLILGTNVPEHRLVGHEQIREVCRRHDLGLVWSVRTFWNFAPECQGRDDLQVAFLERLLRGLAEVSGYAEVATAPWLPIGESGHLLMVVGLLNERPDRCLAGICVKNPHQPRDRTVPLLWTLGTAQEWGQLRHHPRERWEDTGSYPDWTRERAADAWPLSIVIEPGTGHFFCSETMTAYFAAYIDAICRQRLPDAAGDALRPFPLDSGVLAHLPLPGQEDLSVVAQAAAAPEERVRPWFPSVTLAHAAQDLARVDWGARSQLAGLEAVSGCTVEPFSPRFNSVTRITVRSSGEFEVRPVLHEVIPAGFVGAGEALGRAGGEPVVEWICGPVAPLGGGRFRVALDRTWKAGAACYLAIRHDGDSAHRRTVQPASVRLEENLEGEPQTLSWDLPAEVAYGTETVPLTATSSAGLPVAYFVVAGPAVIEGGALRLRPVPPRTRFPVEVTVAAWQWGRTEPPQVRTAPLLRRTLLLTAE